MRTAAVFLLLVSTLGSAEQVTFRRAIELALRGSNRLAMADADRDRARQEYLRARNLFLPQAAVGSGLAYSSGFPLSLEGSAPSVINVQSQQFLWNPAQRDFLKAARVEADAAARQGEDRRQDVILETALLYTELDKLSAAANVLRQQEAAARTLEDVARQRAQEGVDAPVAVTRARLNAARLRLRLAQAEGAADVLRLRLSQLTGVQDFQTVAESIPALPGPTQDDLRARALENSSAIRLAAAEAEARELRARGEGKALLPSADLVGQYALLSRHNNYDEFYRRFQRHNGTVGLVFRFPFLNLAQRASAGAAQAEAVKARRNVDFVKDQVSSETLRLQRALRQLSAARDVARLEYELANSEAEAAVARDASVPERETARLRATESYSAFLDAEFELMRTQLQLMRHVGELEAWVGNAR